MSEGWSAARARPGHPGFDGDRNGAAPYHPIAACAVAAMVSLAFAAQWWVGGDGSGYAVYLVGGLHAPSVREGEIFRIFTSPLLHLHVLHFTMNLSLLLGFGGGLESLVGHARYLLVVALSMLSASLAAVAVPPAGGVLVGSSGAILGMVGAMGVLVLREWEAPPPLLRRMRWVLPICVALDSVLVLLLPERVGWIAHLGGLAGGMGAMALASRGAGPIPLRDSSRWMRLAAAGLAVIFLCGAAFAAQRVASGRICEVILRDDLSQAVREGFETALRDLPVVCAGLAPKPRPASPPDGETPERPRTRSSANRRAP